MDDRKILLVAGHNSGRIFPTPQFGDPGVVLYDDYGLKVTTEHEEAKKIVSAVHEIMKVHDFDNVELLDNFKLNLRQKINYINRFYTGNNIILELHFNSNRGKAGTGVEVYHVHRGKMQKLRAKTISKKLSETLRLRNRGGKDATGRFGIIRETKPIETYIIEIGFMNNKHDFAQVQKFGVQAIIEVCEYLLHKNLYDEN